MSDTRVEQAEKEAAQLRAAILPIFKAVVSNRGDPPCPHGNLPAYPCHGWWCDGCWTLLGDTLFPSAMSGSIFSYREAVKREEESDDARARRELR